MHPLIVFGLIVIPLVATVIMGISFEQHFSKHIPHQGNELKKYFNQED